jgi:molybdate transport system substrate-binding protein
MLRASIKPGLFAGERAGGFLGGLARVACMAVACLLPLGEAAARQLTVSAAASLVNVLREIADAFQTAAPDVSVRLNVGASGTLLQQLAQGAPVDVFASADQATMDRAATRGLIQETSRRDFATSRLVLIEPAVDAVGLGSLHDLARPQVRRIAIGKPASVPAGRYARELLEDNHLWERLAPKFVPADSVRQVLDYVGRGEVEAGFVYATDALVMKDKVKVAASLAGATPVSYPIAVARGSRREDLASRFIAFLATPTAREIFGRHGFGPP